MVSKNLLFKIKMIKIYKIKNLYNLLHRYSLNVENMKVILKNKKKIIIQIKININDKLYFLKKYFSNKFYIIFFIL